MKINELIVVEGKTDIDFLSSFIDADFYQVHGSAVSDEDIAFLSKAQKNRGIIILTDPDFPGLQIRHKIKNAIPDAKEAFVRKEFSIKHNKVGVAESTKEEIEKALKNVISVSKNETKKIIFNNSDLLELGLIGAENSKKLRNEVCNTLHIGFSNAKNLLLKLNSINISKKELEEIVERVK